MAAWRCARPGNTNWTCLRAVRLGVLSIVRNNRRSRIYLTIFPNGFVDVLRSNPSTRSTRP